ncbi:hypothetical protein AB0C84_25380 [Actinomadura sp. NPDC048955]|uniref:hypothetical protein n=1 Tax=Actinomadura sp. NPDC048955 TaxID=3158228 RepID=UPI0033F58046
MSSPSPPEVETETLTALLRYFDWAPRSKVPGRYEVWSADESDDKELIIPLNPSMGDYNELLIRAHRFVISQYGRAARELSRTLNLRFRAGLNSTQWKKETNLEGGIIGWEEGEDLYEAARAQLVASAKATRERRRYHGNSSAYVAKKFLENSFMGQTEVGSFIITAYTPSNQRFHVSKHSEEIHLIKPREAETLPGSAVTETFERALKAIRVGLEEYKKRPRPELFLETVQEGVSYEFTKALSQITHGGDSEIEILHHSHSSDRDYKVQVAFEAVESPILSQVANVFALDPEPQDVTLIGEVTLLSRSTDSSDRVIRLNVADGADVRKARVRLNADQYDVAMEAHRLEANLKISGSLEKEGRLYWLYHPRDLSIVRDEELEDLTAPPNWQTTMFDPPS